MLEEPKPFRVLSLDGGGAKGFYTLGILHEIEAMTGKPLCESFDLIFGTSTGAIIASLAALANTVDDIHALYQAHLPRVMGIRGAAAKTAALEKLASEVYQDTAFTDVKTGIGIVAARHASEVPMIFTSDIKRINGRGAKSDPGFGVSMADAVVASCSAYPFFMTKTVTTSRGEKIELEDGSYCANNPTLFAITQALRQTERKTLRVVSLGVGDYPEPTYWGREWTKRTFFILKFLRRTLNLNTNAMEQLRELLFPEVSIVRINNAYMHPGMATDLMERDPKKLNLLYQSGRESFADHECVLSEFLN